MKSFFCLLLFFVIVSAKAQTDDKATLRHLKEVEWPRAYREQDTILLDKILADEFKMIGSDGEYSDKADQIQYFLIKRNGTCKAISSYTSGDQIVRLK